MTGGLARRTFRGLGWTLVMPTELIDPTSAGSYFPPVAAFLWRTRPSATLDNDHADDPLFDAAAIKDPLSIAQGRCHRSAIIFLCSPFTNVSMRSAHTSPMRFACR